MGDKWPPKCLVSSSRLVRLPSWPRARRTLIQETLCPPLCPSPSPPSSPPTLWLCFLSQGLATPPNCSVHNTTSHFYPYPKLISITNPSPSAVNLPPNQLLKPSHLSPPSFLISFFLPVWITARNPASAPHISSGSSSFPSSCTEQSCQDTKHTRSCQSHLKSFTGFPLLLNHSLQSSGSRTELAPHRLPAAP